MSNEAINWVMKLPKDRVPSSSAKFVLFVMADQVTTDLFFMSVETVVRATAQDRKTVLANLARLVRWGLVEDTGERRGRTGQIPVYRLMMGDGLFDNSPYSNSTKNGTGPKSGTVPETGPVPKADGNSTVFPSKQSQKRDTDPKDPKDPKPRSPRVRAREAPEPTNPDFGPVTMHPGPLALACQAMIDGGVPASRVNASHPAVAEALAAGVTPQELTDTARELTARGTGPPAMVYVLRTATGRRHDFQTRQGDPASGTHQRSSQPDRRPSAVDLVADSIRDRRARAATRPNTGDGPGDVDESVVATG